jgi:hypothetical protein
MGAAIARKKFYTSFDWHIESNDPEYDLGSSMDRVVALKMAFCTALLITGSTKAAEAAVIDGLDACEELSDCGLLIAVVKSAVRRHRKPEDAHESPAMLPPELRRLFILQPLLRKCFVLRILARFSPEVCAELLDISIVEFEDAAYAAFTQLPECVFPNTHLLLN